MTKAQVVKTIKDLGLRATCTDGEWRVSLRNVTKYMEEATAYYTNDEQDAIDTAERMAREIGNAY